MAQQGLERVETIPLEAVQLETPVTGRRRGIAPRVAARRTAVVDVPVGPGESAVVLVEQDGAWSWVLPSPPATRGRAVAAPRALRFAILVVAEGPRAARSAGRGPLVDLVYRGLRAFVLRFSRAVVGAVGEHLERGIAEGLVAIRHPDPATWALLQGPLPAARSAERRVLLLLHGTYSSTRGSFGALGLSRQGQAFLERSLARYDSVLGYDHRTMTVDPAENARRLAAALAAACGPGAPSLDVVSFSRGGLVHRSWLELPPAPGSSPEFGSARGVLVAVPNRGTPFASLANWHRLLDLITNLGVAGAEIVGSLAPAAAPPLLGEMVRGVGLFAQAVASAALSDSAVLPGLAAMDPASRFLGDLNRPGPMAPGSTRLHPVRSDFEADLGAAVGSGLSPRLLAALADGAVDRVMGEANDLLVSATSARAADPDPSLLGDELDFGTNPSVFHTAYFGRPELAGALSRWLGVPGGGAPAIGRGPSTRRERTMAGHDTITPYDVRGTDATHVVIELFGGDNNLSEYVRDDLAEMLAGNGGPFAVIGLADFADGGGQVIEVTSSHGHRVIEELGEIDTGDPETLATFIARALASYPGERHRALGFWDHGTGVFDEHDPNEVDLTPRLRGVSRRMGNRQRPARHLFFADRRFVTDARLRAMLHDDTSGGVLTNFEASGVVRAAFARAGFTGQLDLVFSDTCLNGMVEVLDQFRPFTRVVVGSEDLEPGDGWDYRQLFSMMTAAPPASADDWGAMAVAAYEAGYRDRPSEHPCTLAAFRTDNQLTGALARLVESADPLGRGGFWMLNGIRAVSQGFADRDTTDIRDFATRLAAETDGDLKAAADQVVTAFDAACIRNVALGDTVRNARGLAFWFPRDAAAYAETAGTYRRLEFDKQARWADYLASHLDA